MIKLGIIGAGRIGKVHGESITNFVSNAEVKSIADPYMDKETETWAESMGITGVYKDYKKIIDDIEIDAVLVCSSTDTHAQISIEAAEAGKDIFCEKPVDLDPARIQEVIDTVEENGVKFQVGFNRRFDHNFKAVKDAVEAGKVGDPHIINITSRDPEAPPIEYVKVSGGIFLDMTIHDFDMVRFLSGSEVEEVYAAGGVLVDPEIGEAGDIDTAVITLKLKSGAIAVIDNSREAVYGYDQRAEVFGSKGSVRVENDRESTAKLSTADRVEEETPLYFFLERYMDSYAEEIKSFVNALENDEEVPVGGEAGLKPVLIGLAAKKSIEEGRAVKISEVE
jgi:myo-inositol 2-dehydrogenase/D-chiro-inositol 1-dehydrogenase